MFTWWLLQALVLKIHQIDWVMRRMGYSLDVHKIYYRSTSDIIERTQVAKILLLQDTGRLDKFANQSLEDIQLSGRDYFIFIVAILVPIRKKNLNSGFAGKMVFNRFAIVQWPCIFSRLFKAYSTSCLVYEN